jgi:FixJ family two-component response regulator
VTTCAIVANSDSMRETLSDLLTSDGFRIAQMFSKDDLLRSEALQADIGVAVVDHGEIDTAQIDSVTKHIEEKLPNVPIIIVTQYPGELRKLKHSSKIKILHKPNEMNLITRIARSTLESGNKG